LRAQPTEASAAPTNVLTVFPTGQEDKALMGSKTTYSRRATDIPGATPVRTEKGFGSTRSGGSSTKKYGATSGRGWWFRVCWLRLLRLWGRDLLFDEGGLVVFEGGFLSDL
jgi:hypothetical protein